MYSSCIFFKGEFLTEDSSPELIRQLAQAFIVRVHSKHAPSDELRYWWNFLITFRNVPIDALIKLTVFDSSSIKKALESRQLEVLAYLHTCNIKDKKIIHNLYGWD